MPNWVSNIVKCDNSDALRQLCDFNRIVPQPLVLDIICGGISDHVAQLFALGKTWRDLLENPIFLDAFDEEKRHPLEPRYTAEQAARRYWLGYKLHGYLTWYEWRLEYWGTKWNASEYHLDPENGEVWFETAWSHPYPVIIALSQQFPDCVFSVSYADEDIGSNTGEYRVQNGELLCGGELVDGSREAYEMAFSHWGCAEDYILRNDGYHYIDDDEDDDSGVHIAAPASPKLYLTSALDNGAGGH